MKIKMGRLLNIVCVVIGICCSTFSVVHADSVENYYTEVDELAGIEFDTYDDLAMFSMYKTDILQENNIEAADYIWNMDSLYVPSEYADRVSEFEFCLITPTYVCTSFLSEEIRCQFYYYYAEESGKRKLDNAKHHCAKNQYSACSIINGEKQIYYYELHNESYYVWNQENKYFVFRVNEVIRDKYIEFCNAEAVLLPSGRDVMMEDSVDKAPNTFDFTTVSILSAVVFGIASGIFRRRSIIKS